MSRIGKLPVAIPEKVQVSVSGNTVQVKGDKGNLDFTFSPQVEVKVVENEVIISPKNEDAAALWGTTRSIIENMVLGVSQGYTKSLEVNGVGYKFEIQGQKIVLSLGYSHKIEMQIPQGITAQMDEKLKNVMHISGIDKQKVGQFASQIKAKRKPEPYKGKGVKYLGEQIRRKAGKSGK